MLPGAIRLRFPPAGGKFSARPFRQTRAADSNPETEGTP
jgi:hypothetical protein